MKSEEPLEWKTEHCEDGILISANKSLDAFAELTDLLHTYDIEKKDNNSIFIDYESVYELYYDEYDNNMDTYKYFNLPEMYKGICEIENKNNFLVDKEVYYVFRFKELNNNYKLEYGNILVCDLDNEYRIIPKKLYDLIEKIKKYNKSYDMRSDESLQFEMLKMIKDYSLETDIKLNDRLKNEETPVMIDKLKIDFEDDGETIEIYPKLSDDNDTNRKILKEIGSYSEIRNSYSTNIDGKKVRYVIKHKKTLENIIKNNKSKGQKRLDILSGKSEIFQDENIDISDFGPRVTGFGYLTYKSTSSTVQTNDLDWLDNNIEPPYIQGTNMDGDYENIVLKPCHRDMLKKKLVDLNFSEKESDIVEFASENGNTLKIIMSKDEIKNEIANIDSRIKSPADIKKASDIQNLLKICDKYEDEEYIPYKNIYISKGKDDIKEELLEQLENIKEQPASESKGKKKTLLIAENLEDKEYEEYDSKNNDIINIEIPDTLRNNIQLFDYQKECLGKLQKVYLSSNVNGFLLCDDMGLGKTLQLLSFLAWVKEREEIKPSLIVAPSSLLNNWDCNPDGEIQKFFEEGYFSTERVVGKITPDKIEKLKNADIVFITYESLRINNVALGKINWKVMICDEAQKIKSPRTLVTVAAKAQNANFKIICSATPIENSLEDLWTLTDFSKPGLLGSLKEFKKEYIKINKGITESDLEDTNNRLYEKIEKYYIRREKNVLPKTLPKKFIKMYYVKPTEEELDILEYIKDTENFTISAIQKMLAICIHVDVIDEKIPTRANIDNLIGRSSKMMALKNILESIKEKNEKVIIFTRLRKVQKIIYYAVNKWFNMECNIVNGEEHKLDSRTRKINEFRNSYGFNVIILSPEVAGFGITITEANHVIHYTRLWNPAKEDQATDRVYRIGQNKDVTVHYPIIAFQREEVKEYEAIDEFVKDNSKACTSYLSPEEKLNILLSRKKDMLLRFFLAGSSVDISTDDFRMFDFTENNNGIKNKIVIDSKFNNMITPHEFEALTAVLYEKLGYETYLTSRSNDKGVDVIAKNDNEILFIQCKHTLNNVSIEASKDILYAKETYKEYIDMNLVKSYIVTSSNEITATLKKSNTVIIYREILSCMMDKYDIFKDEIDVKDKQRYAFEEIVRILK